MNFFQRTIPLCFLWLQGPDAHAMNWQFRSTGLAGAEGGYLTGFKIPLNSSTQLDYDNVVTKTGLSQTAADKIKTLQLRGPEGFAHGTMTAGYEGTSEDLQWQSTLNLRGTIVGGNSGGRFFSPSSDPLFPNQGRLGRNSGWLTGADASLQWLPFDSFAMRLRSSFSGGSNLFKDHFLRLKIHSEIDLRAGDFLIQPSFFWQRLLAMDAQPASDVSAWSIDVDWLASRSFRFQNPKGYELIKIWRSSALGSPLLITALENEGRFLELNVTPKILLTEGLSIISHFRNVWGSTQSYISPLLATELMRRGRQQNNWNPPAASAEYSSTTFELRSTLNKKVESAWNLYAGVFYKSQSNTFSQAPNSNFIYSELIETARESSIRYFLGSEFLL
jgi:hypothetical protein